MDCTGTLRFQQSIQYSSKKIEKNYYFTCWALVSLLHLSVGFSLSSMTAELVCNSNVCSSSQCFTLGLLQGTVLTLSVFLFYINNLASSCNSNAVIALFADDVSNLTTARKKEDAEAAAQSVVISVLIWNQEWKLNLNTDKIEVCPFSIWSNGSTWQHAFFVGTQKIWVNITLSLLGVILGRTVTINILSLSSSLYIIRATVHTS